MIDEIMKNMDNINLFEELNDYSHRPIKKLLANMEITEEYIKEYLLISGKWYTKYLKNIWFNDTFASLEQYRVELLEHFNTEELHLETRNNHKIDM